MVEPINLNRARKARRRAVDTALAVENRIRFGRTKVEREAASASEDLGRRRLEAHRREGEPR